MEKVKDRELSALAHIERNGNLLFWGGSAYEAERMFRVLAESQRIERNAWTGEWRVVHKEGRYWEPKR